MLHGQWLLRYGSRMAISACLGGFTSGLEISNMMFAMRPVQSVLIMNPVIPRLVLVVCLLGVGERERR